MISSRSSRARGNSDATSTVSPGACAPEPRGPRPSTVGMPSEPGRFASPAAAGHRRVDLLAQLGGDRRSLVRQAGETPPAPRADGATASAPRPAHRRGRPEALEHVADRSFVVGGAEAQSQLRLGSPGDHVRSRTAGEPADVHRPGRRLGQPLADCQQLIDQLVDRRHTGSAIQSRVRLAAGDRQLHPAHATPADLEPAAGQRRFKREDGDRSVTLGAHDVCPRRAADLLVRSKDDAHRPVRRPVEVTECPQQRHEAGLHVEDARPGRADHR